MENNPEERWTAMWRHYVEEEEAIDNYWSEEAQRLWARDRSASIIQNNWRKIYNTRNNSINR